MIADLPYGNCAAIGGVFGADGVGAGVVVDQNANRVVGDERTVDTGDVFCGFGAAVGEFSAVVSVANLGDLARYDAVGGILAALWGLQRNAQGGLEIRCAFNGLDGIDHLGLGLLFGAAAGGEKKQ